MNTAIAARSGLLALAAAVVLLAAPLRGEDAYYLVRLSELKLEGELPKPPQYDRSQRERIEAMAPYAVIEGEGEAYPGPNLAWPGIFHPQDSPEPVIEAPDEPALDEPEIDESGREVPDSGNTLAIRAPAGREVRGWLVVPKGDWSGMEPLRFVVPAGRSTKAARRNFYLAKREYYKRLASRNLPGGAWFRHQVHLAHAKATRATFGDYLLEDPALRWNPGAAESNFQRTFALVSGGRAVSENLQLDRLLPSSRQGEETVPLSEIEGITIAEMDWDKLTEGIDPQLDPTARFIPADQYALFFPDFQSLVTLVDESTFYGTPVLHLLQPRAEDARSLQRYQRQLGVELDALARAFGPQVVENVAITGSDPYLRTGTDLAVLFQSSRPAVLHDFLAARQAAAAHNQPESRDVSGRLRQLDYRGFVSPAREISSYLAVVGNTVIVTNSLVQLERLATAAAGETESLAQLPEYRFFRHRYPRGDAQETALLILTDGAIRRWASPKWRIATSRRTRAAAILAELQARHFDELVAGRVEPRPLETDLDVPELGTLTLTHSGVVSSTYGALDFLTPISELEFTHVNPEEAQFYGRWRDGYQQNWSQYFDPIAVRLSIRPDQVGADLTVMPLIEQSDYRWLIELAQGAQIAPDAGDPHGALAHLAVAINRKSPALRLGRGSLAVVEQLVGPVSWLGESVSIYADAGPFWKDFAETLDQEGAGTDEFLVENAHRIPVAFRAEVADSLRLAAFLTALKGVLETTAPGMTVWETREHQGQPYVRIEATERAAGVPKLAIYYAATPRSLTVSFNEELIHRALEREAARQRKSNPEQTAEQPAAAPDNLAAAGGEARPWLGSSLALQVDGQTLHLLAAVLDDNYQAMMHQRAWANIPILNEWRRRYPDRDPLELHARWWETVLRCPGGGQYVWDEEYQTMASTVYGHPGRPQTGPALPAAFQGLQFINTGVTFEENGLRARLQLDRSQQP